VQRHFRYVLGISPKTLQQISRARRAVELLLAGSRIADVAFGLGFADQAHLTRSLKKLMGQTPAAFANQTGPGVG
jgi:AraC-like DNA-binding protein